MPNTHELPPSETPSTFETELRNDHKAKLFTFKGKPWPLLIGVLVLIGGVGWGASWWLNNPKNAANSGALAQKMPPTSVELAQLDTGIIEQTSDVVGTIEARDAVVLRPEIGGRINQILVEEGDRVSKGTVIVNLDKEDWQAELLEAQARLANTQARLAELEAGSRDEDIEEAQASFREAETRLRNAKQGSRVEEIAQAEAQVNSAQASAELAEKRVERYEELTKEGAISEDEFQEYLTEARSATANLEEAKRRLSQLQKSRSSDVDELASAVEREAQNLRRVQNGPRQEVIAQAKADVSEAIAQVKMAEVNVNKTQVVAPISGVVGDIPVEIGDYVSQGDTLTTLTGNDVLELNLSIPLEKASQLRLGLPVEIINTQGKAIATGKISFIAPNVTADSQLVLAKATFKTSNKALLNRQFMQARVIWEKRRGILIPATAVSRLGAQTFVFVAKPNEDAKEDEPPFTAQQRQVELGNLQGNNYQVIDGLTVGEKIITAGILQLKDGAPIQEIKNNNEQSTMNN
ncbi:MAG: efflux RND transporter periplasmic adaptor subunit [Cyanobacteria bacterium P01_G01_bin.49]